MRKLIYILALVLLSGCGKEEISDRAAGRGVSIRFVTGLHNLSRVVDTDNLAEEQIIHNISLFLTEPGSDAITHRYVHVGFSSAGDYTQISLPLTPDELQTRDIYAVANHDNDITLEALSSIQELETMQTPYVDKNNNLDPMRGFCMYGMLSGFDFNNTDAATAQVELERTCAKYRINLTFPQDPSLSTVNSFVIGKAANYTFIGENTGQSIPDDAYFNFADPTPLNADGQGVYTNLAYVYEATEQPVMYIYTRMGGKEQIFTANLPVPERNYLYGIDVEVFAYTSTRTSGSSEIRITVTDHQ